jgi:Flp pilus assembly protein CpaB
MAIVAGLIFAWVFKVVLLAPKEKPAPPATRQMTVAALNIRDKMTIYPHQVKTVTVSEEEYQRLVDNARKEGKVLLEGNQPVYRTTKVPVYAEKPIFDHQLEPFEFTPALSTRLKAGYRAVNLRLVPEHCEGGLIRVKDRVDVLCTMTNENPILAGGNTATAVIAKGVEVIARNDTTETYDAYNAYTGVGEKDGPKSYTLQATPFRASLIDLARKLGGEFTLVLSTDPGSGDDATKDPDIPVVSTMHLAAVFGYTPPPAERPDWLVEHMVGIKRVGYQTFPAASQRPTTNGTGNGDKKKADTSTGTNTSQATPPRQAISAASSDMNKVLASLRQSAGAANDFGFGPGGNGGSGPTWAVAGRPNTGQTFATRQQALLAMNRSVGNNFGFGSPGNPIGGCAPKGG